MQTIIILIWVTQGMLMLFDEFYFHRKRILGKWERIGHPIDTLLFLSCFIYTLTFSRESIISFIVLSVISSLIITKDEWVHTKECQATENWLHALLFIIHPVSLFVLYIAWQSEFQYLIKIQFLIIFTFFVYQVIYWNVLKFKRI